MFELDDLIRVAKRENNFRRKYLYVNPLQGKHMPVSPGIALKLFSGLREKLASRYPGERLLVIGFAETATAIGSSLAYGGANVSHYISTTREDLSGAAYLVFAEAHSHAPEQRLALNGFAEVLGDPAGERGGNDTGNDGDKNAGMADKRVDRIVFAEDEVTTGNTIMNLVRLIRERWGSAAPAFGIASVLNSMTAARLSEFAAQGVPCDYLFRIPFEYRISSVDSYSYGSPEKAGDTEDPASNDRGARSDREAATQIIRLGHYRNPRFLSGVQELRSRTDQFVKAALERLPDLKPGAGVLILGTEELMFPGLLLGAALEQRRPDLRVRFHATTRSPIAVSREADYPLHRRWDLPGLYDSGRRTFIYNLDSYDQALIVTDSCFWDRGLPCLETALRQAGNRRITLIQWGDFRYEEQL